MKKIEYKQFSNSQLGTSPSWCRILSCATSIEDGG